MRETAPPAGSRPDARPPSVDPAGARTRRGWDRLLGAPALPRLSTFWRYAIPPLATLAVFLLQLGSFAKPDIAPFVFFYVGVVISAWLGGRWPGLLAVALSAAVANYYFIEGAGWSVTEPAIKATVLFVVAASIVALLCAAFRDSVIESRRVADAMQRQSDMLELSHDAILVWRPDTGIEAWNHGAQELYGYTAEEALGRSTHELLRTRWPIPWGAIESTLAVHRVWEGELAHTTRDGRVVTVSARLQIVRGADGADRVLESNRDVTDRIRVTAEREQLLEELRDSDRRKSEFLAVLSHELRNPLAPIRNSVYVLERAVPGSEAARRSLRVMDRQVAHLTRLIDDLLDVNRISSGKIRLQHETVSLRDIARGVADDLRESFERAGIRFECCLPDDPLVAVADRTRIAQVVGNLLQNAAKFTPPGGWARVTLRRDGPGRACLEVSDSGLGIDRALLGRIFTSFVQGERTLERSHGGLGLGLALVKGLVELHGGTVSAYSEGPGRGATFAIRLPLAPEGILPAPRVLAGNGGGGRRVLVIEDSGDTASSLKEALELNGHTADVALTGPRGIELARSIRPDAVLCDLGLPGADGYEVARTLRADPRLEGLLLVALSGYALPEDVSRSEEAGFDHHMAKPPDLEALDALLRSFPSRSRA